MSLSSDERFVLATADKLIVIVQRLTMNDPVTAVAALGVAMMSIARGDDMTRQEINNLLDIVEKGMADA